MLRCLADRYVTTALILYDKDAYADKYRFEATTHRLLDQTDCGLLSSYQADCFMAQHKIDASGKALEVLKAVTDSAWAGGLCFFIALAFIFLSTPFARNAYSARN